MTWLRMGECPPERCGGRCCTHIGIWFSAPATEAEAFLAAAQVRGMSVKSDGPSFLLDIPHRCQYLTDGIDPRFPAGLCGLHPDIRDAANAGHDAPARPSFCESWPTEPSQLVNDPGCGFTFRWVEEGASIGIN